MSNRAYIWLFVLGLVFGVAQLFYVRDLTVENVTPITETGVVSCLALTPECGVCLGESKDGLCYEGEYQQQFRGFPLRVGAYGASQQTDISASLYVNILIFALGLPLIGMIYSLVARKIRKNR